ncbi:MAG: hypothetical protein OXT49_02840 [Gammaproteobacteria bacterium]|nr:hypothetical protein [Gammaproteobacteria bacterium]
MIKTLLAATAVSVASVASAQPLAPMLSLSFEFGGTAEQVKPATLSLVGAYEKAGVWKPLVGAAVSKQGPVQLSLLGAELDVYQPRTHADAGGIKWGYIAGGALLAGVVAAAGGSSDDEDDGFTGENCGGGSAEAGETSVGIPSTSVNCRESG